MKKKAKKVKTKPRKKIAKKAKRKPKPKPKPKAKKKPTAKKTAAKPKKVAVPVPTKKDEDLVLASPASPENRVTDGAGRLNVEIVKEPLQRYTRLGVCPSCKQGPIAMMTIHGNIADFGFACESCQEKFHWGNMGSQVICHAQSDSEMKTPYDFGEILAEGEKRFFVSHLIPL